jgi:hypothetical protein
MLHWYWRYIPCGGVKLGFEEFSIFPDTGPAIVHLQRREPSHRIKIRRKHLLEDPDGAFKKIDQIDFEISLRSISGDGVFFMDPVHVFSFLLMIRTGGWMNAPAILTASILDEPDSADPHIFCSSFLDVAPTHYRNATLSAEDAAWIRDKMGVGLRFTNEAKFQNAMQALTSIHCVPYANTGLLLAWSGLEALFAKNQEISFRLCLYISNFLKRGPERVELFESLRQSYDARSKVAHGSCAKITDIHEHADYTRDILRACREKCVEMGGFPNPKQLVFGE